MNVINIPKNTSENAWRRRFSETLLRDMFERHCWETCLRRMLGNSHSKSISKNNIWEIEGMNCSERLFWEILKCHHHDVIIFKNFWRLRSTQFHWFSQIQLYDAFFEDFYIIHYFNVFFENLTVRNSLCWFFEIDHFTCFQSYFSTWFFENITRILCENCLKISLRNCPKKSHFRREGWVSREIELIGSKLKITWSLQNVSILSLRACVKKHWTFTFFNYHLTIEPLKTIESSFFKNRLKRFFEEVLWR